MKKVSSFNFNAHETGLYSFCFSNKMSRVSHKKVDLEIEVGDSTPEEDLLFGDHLDPLEEEVTRLHSVLESVKSGQGELKQKLKAHQKGL